MTSASRTLPPPIAKRAAAKSGAYDAAFDRDGGCMNGRSAERARDLRRVHRGMCVWKFANSGREILPAL
jgi:hypothetical protein